MALKEHTSMNSDFSAFIKQVTCDASSKECMSGKCSECANAIEKYAPANKSYPIHYQQWKSVDNRFKKVYITGTVDDCFDKLSLSCCMHMSKGSRQPL